MAHALNSTSSIVRRPVRPSTASARRTPSVVGPIGIRAQWQGKDSPDHAFQKAGMCAVAAALSISAAGPALADLNKWEAGSFGEFGQGSAQQFGAAELIKKDFHGQDLRRSNFTAADIRQSNFNQTNLLGAYLVKTVAYKTSFVGADLSDSLMDRGVFVEADFTNAILKRVILTLSDLNEAKIDGADFTDALIDKPQQRKLCTYASGTNPVTGADTRKSLGCGSRIRGSPSRYMSDDTAEQPKPQFAANEFSSGAYR